MTGCVVGRPTPLADGVEKVTGRARFTADLGSTWLPGEILRSPHAHAEIVRIDTSRARALPGVRAVLTGADCSVAYGILPIAHNEYPLARERVRYWGEPVAAVAAEDESTARAALELIEVEYRPLPAYFSAKEALAPGAVHLHAGKAGNIEREVDHTFGDVQGGFAAADLVREARFHYAEVTHVHTQGGRLAAEALQVAGGESRGDGDAEPPRAQEPPHVRKLRRAARYLPAAAPCCSRSAWACRSCSPTSGARRARRS